MSWRRWIVRWDWCGVCGVAALCALGGMGARGDIIHLDATDSGFVTERGGSAKGDGTVAPSAKFNYSVGFEAHYTNGALFAPTGPLLRKNYFVFDLSGVTGEVLSASLELSAGVYESGDPTETYAIREIADQAGALGDADALAGGLVPTEFDEPTDPLVGMADALYDKIPGPGPGPLFLASFVMTSNLNASTIEIVLNAAGIAHLNSNLGSRVILGGFVSTVTGTNDPQQPFGFTGSDMPVLELTGVVLVPEPSVLLMVMMAAGAGMILARARPRS